MSSCNSLLLQPNGKKCRRQGNWGQNRLIMVNRQAGEAKYRKGIAKEWASNGQQGLDGNFGMPVRIGCQP